MIITRLELKGSQLQLLHMEATEVRGETFS